MKKITLVYLSLLMPVLLTISITFTLIVSKLPFLSQQSLNTLETFFIDWKKKELSNSVSFALASIKLLDEIPPIDKTSKKKFDQSRLAQIGYHGNHDYFFICDTQGLTMAYPNQSYRIGSISWNLTDTNTTPITCPLIDKVDNGASFHHFFLKKPSSSLLTQKIHSSDYLAKWNGVISTDDYLGNINNQLNQIKTQINQNIHSATNLFFKRGLLSIWLSIMVLFIFIIVKYKKSQQKVGELRQQIIDLQEQERRRISHELHDGIVQLLVCVNFYFESMLLELRKQKIKIPSALTHARTTLDQAINETRRISHEMHPRILVELGLFEAIEALISQFSQRTHISVYLQKPKLRNFLTTDISTSLYRVVQESLTNIEKHSGATKVDIIITAKQKWFGMTIKDNGQGPVQQRSTQTGMSMGLRNLRERIEYHQGQFDYRFNQSGGEVFVKIPLFLHGI